MKLKIFSFCLFLLLFKVILSNQPPAPPIPISQDKILAIIYHTAGSSIVLQSDLNANLEGVPKNLDDVILERLMVIDAEILKIAVTEADIDRHLSQVQKQYNLSQEQTIEVFKTMGLNTLEQIRNQLKTKLIIDTVLDHRVRRRAMPGTQMIQKYYDEHPLVKEAEYELSQAFVPHAGRSPTLQKIKVQQSLDDGQIDKLVKWDQGYILKDSDIASDKNFIKSLDINQTIIAGNSDEGISLLRLISKKPSYLVPLKEREAEIVSILGKEQYEKSFDTYKASLFKMARIKYLK